MTNTFCKIQLLGGLRVQQDKRETTRFSTQKTASLLAYLAYYRHQNHPREILVEMLWPESDPRVGRTRLSTALCSLRKLLEPEGVPPGSVLTSTHFAIGLNPAVVTTDVAAFLAACRKAARATDPAERKQHLQQAVEGYTGDLLPGFYEDWVLTEQRRLTELFQQAQRERRAREKRATVPDTTSASLPRHPLPPKTEISSSLPPTFTRFFGRTELLKELHQWLSPASTQRARPRLLTITGVGGMGKTRLSLEVARGLLEEYSGAVWFVPLAEVNDPASIGSAIADALSLIRSGPQEPLEQAISFLRERTDAPSLLVLDNFEQLVEGGAEIVQTLLEQVPTLTCLVTSRRLLNLTAEQETTLQPLPIPRGEVSPDHLTMYESVRLLIDRAKAVRPTFQVTNQNAPDVAELCYRLEGIPLAIELAAARTQVLTPAQILSQIQQRFAFLVSRKRDVVARHQTLHAAIEWSYRLLAPEVQRFFTRLSVFRGGWMLEAAEAVCEEPKALEYLEQLREWSLVQVEESEQRIRFTTLETLREFAEEQLNPDEKAAIAHRHMEYFSSLPFETWKANVYHWWQNYSFALTTASERQNVLDALQLGWQMEITWYMQGRLTEGRQILEGLLSHPAAQEPTEQRAFSLSSLAVLTLMQGDYRVAQPLLEECLAIGRRSGNKMAVHIALARLGEIAIDTGQYEKAEFLLQESIQLSQEPESAGEKYRLGVLALHRGLDDVAQGYFEKAGSNYYLAQVMLAKGNSQQTLALAENILERNPSWYRGAVAQAIKGLALCRLGRLESGLSLLHDSLRRFHAYQVRHHIAYTLAMLGEAEYILERPERAIRLYAASIALLGSLGIRFPSWQMQAMEKALITLRAKLGDERYSRCWNHGETMTWEEAVAYALEAS